MGAEAEAARATQPSVAEQELISSSEGCGGAVGLEAEHTGINSSGVDFDGVLQPRALLARTWKRSGARRGGAGRAKSAQAPCKRCAASGLIRIQAAISLQAVLSCRPPTS